MNITNRWPRHFVTNGIDDGDSMGVHALLENMKIDGTPSIHMRKVVSKGIRVLCHAWYSSTSPREVRISPTNDSGLQFHPGSKSDTGGEVKMIFDFKT
jgi:hypothetical protein